MQSDENGRGRFIAIVPARGGSQGLPRKNLMAVQGISLVARAVLLARRLEEIPWIVVSTDDDEIADEGRRAGAMVPFRRPPAISRSTTPMLKVLEHTWEWFQSTHGEQVSKVDGLVLLTPTSPMRREEHVRGAIELYRTAREGNPEVAAIHTVSPVPEKVAPEIHWRKMASVESGTGADSGYFERCHMTNEQPVYYRNGAAVVLDPVRLDALNLKSGLVLPYVIEESLVSIDSRLDLDCAENCGRILEPDVAEVDWDSKSAQGVVAG